MNNVKAEEITTLGRKLDNGVTTVEFNLAPMIDTYGLPDTFMLLLRRNGDEESYAAENFTVSEDKGYWVVTSTDLARTFIYAEIAWIKDDQVYHGEVFKFDVDKSLGTPSDGVNAVMDASTAIPQVLTRLSTAETNISNVNSRIDTEVLPYFARFSVGLNGVTSGISSLNTDLRNLRREIINPNLSETSQLHVTTINGAINQNGEHFARVEDGKTYTFSADIAIEELPSALEGRILRNNNTSATQVFSIAEGSTGRVSATFTAVTDGVIYLQGELGSGYDIGDLILDEVQVEEGDYATPYCEYGVVLLPDTEARGEISRINEEISNLRSKRIAGSIVSVADRGLIDDAGLIFPDTEEAFINAKENGFDWVKVYIRKTKDKVVCLSYNGIVSTQSNASVDIATVNYDDIVNPPMLFCDAVNICNLYGIGMVVSNDSIAATSYPLLYVINQFSTKNISHAFETSDINILSSIRQYDTTASVIYVFETKPQIDDLRNSSDYSTLRNMAANGGVHITFPLAGSDLNQDYVDALNVLGFSLVCGSGESFNTYRLYAKYCSMMISDRYKVSDLLN
jgi:hypothetical protein